MGKDKTKLKLITAEDNISGSHGQAISYVGYQRASFHITNNILFLPKTIIPTKQTNESTNPDDIK